MNDFIEAGSLAALSLAPINKNTSRSGFFIIAAGIVIIVGLGLKARTRILELQKRKY